MKDNIRVKLDLKKRRYNLIASSNKIVRNIESVKFCYIDINCRPQIKRSDDSDNYRFFHFLNELKSMLAIDIWLLTKVMDLCKEAGVNIPDTYY